EVVGGVLDQTRDGRGPAHRAGARPWQRRTRHTFSVGFGGAIFEVTVAHFATIGIDGRVQGCRGLRDGRRRIRHDFRARQRFELRRFAFGEGAEGSFVERVYDFD